MAETDEMTIDERRKYLYKMWGRYQTATKTEKGLMLNDMARVTGMNRKYIIRVLNGRLSRKKRSRERGPTYGPEVEDAVRVIAKALDYPCAERLKPMLVFMAEHLMRQKQLSVSEESLKKLEKISVSTLKRMFPKIRQPAEKLAHRQPPKRHQNTLREAYPMRRIPLETPDPGHFEVDLVLHCDTHNTGEFIHTIQMTDVATGWSEIQAVFGRSFRVMADGFACILAQLPFPVLEIHPDNGAEFFNRFLLRFWKEKVPDLAISRSRPYHKNDNRFVEENNRSLVRSYVGHGRLDTLEHLSILRDLYQDLCCYHNFFLPVMKTVEKVVLDEIHYKRVFDQPRPPLDRLAETGVVNPARLDALFTQRDQTDVMALRDRMDKNILDLWKVITPAVPVPVNIYQTLREEDKASVSLSFEPSIPVR
jgi:hypothetical protein